MLWAVLTGDLVRSTRADPSAVAESLDAIAQTVLARLATANGRQTVHFGRHRGDGWQVALAEGALGLRAAMLVLAALRSRRGALDTRLSLGLGAVDHIGDPDLSDARGAAFTASGQALDAMGRGDRFQVSGPAATPRDRIIGSLMHEIARRWSREQAEVAQAALDPDPPSNLDLARTLGITPQAVSARLSGGGIQIMRSALADWEMTMRRGSP